MSEVWLRLRGTFWAVPMLCTAVAVLLGLVLTSLDDRLETSLTLPFLFTGGPEGARSVLSAIITSMISFTGLVFSITVVVLQLTSSQFSPRVLRTFLQDRFNQLVLGVFVATFVYALVVLRAVHGTAQVDSFVPQLAVTVAFLILLASVVLFLGYIHHIAQSIRAATIISNIGDDTRRLLEVQHPVDARTMLRVAPPPGTGRPVPAPRARCGPARGRRRLAGDRGRAPGDRVPATSHRRVRSRAGLRCWRSVAVTSPTVTSSATRWFSAASATWTRTWASVCASSWTSPSARSHRG